MISIGIDSFFLIFIALAIVVLSLLWAGQLWLTTAKGWSLSDDQLCRCRHCGFVHVAKRIETMPRCPSCDELNRPMARNKKSKRIRYT